MNNKSNTGGAQGGLGERRQATVIFTDLVGFTAFSEKYGEEAAYSLMQHISTLMADAIERQVERSGTLQVMELWRFLASPSLWKTRL
jgi:class 3 adenylate cyclase